MPQIHRTLAVCLVLTGSTVAAAAATAASETRLTFDAVFADDEVVRSIRGLEWSPDGHLLAYRRQDADGAALWVLDLRPETPRPEAVLRPESGPLLEDFRDLELEWSPDGTSLSITADGDLYLLHLGDRALRRLTTTEAEEEGATFSPDGTSLAFVRDSDLHRIDLASGREQALTEGGREGETLHAITDWVYWEELWGRDSTGFWWSPDGRRIAYYEFDETPVATYPVVDFLPRYPEVEWQKYPKAGTANPRVRIGVLDLASGRTVWMATGEDPTAYLARVHWHPDGEHLAIQRLNREQDRLDLLFCGIADGTCRTVLTETWPTWVNLGDELSFLSDGRFLWGSERSGWRHLYLYAADGSLIRQLTEGEAAVVSLDAVDPAGRWAVYTAYGPGSMGAAERRVYRLPLDGSGPRALAVQPGWNEADVAPASGLWVHTWSDRDHPEVAVIRDASGALVTELPTATPRYDPASLPHWELFQIDGPGGVKLPARMLKPEGFDPQRRYPAIMYHYGCPASQVVLDRWESRGRNLWHKLMAQRGYLILAVDNPGSLFFGKRGEDRMHRRFGPINLETQLAAVAYLKSLPYVDGSRLGLWGWSGGGANTLYNLLNAPGVWKAGVAGAPVTDWHLYDTIWTERYLDSPEGNEEGYRASSPLTYADQLADALLILHGTADDNVHPQNTLAMANALIEAGKPFEDAIYPGQKHGFRGRSLRHAFERITAFFDRHLQPGEGGER